MGCSLKQLVRLWRIMKYRKRRLWCYSNFQLIEVLVDEWVGFYSDRRRHQSLSNLTPWSVDGKAQQKAA